ncbi:glutamate rich 3-like [Lethenteron reissneri]|uniref:glutamate rich 3-like n=1 Tax=Lethenteron reissneri TaxID=7753 RepID=UPI002AB73151|nr:glutamate rich 3-like [Lethenteron reissneri]
MSASTDGLLRNYNSLTDANLGGYFSGDRVRRHLRRMGLITRDGRLVSEKEHRQRLCRHEQRDCVHTLLAHTVLSKALDVERLRQVEIVRKLQEISCRERVLRVRVEHAVRGVDGIVHIAVPPQRATARLGRGGLRHHHRATLSDGAAERSRSASPSPPPDNMRQRPRAARLPRRSLMSRPLSAPEPDPSLRPGQGYRPSTTKQGPVMSDSSDGRRHQKHAWAPQGPVARVHPRDISPYKLPLLPPTQGSRAGSAGTAQPTSPPPARARGARSAGPTRHARHFGGGGCGHFVCGGGHDGVDGSDHFVGGGGGHVGGGGGHVGGGGGHVGVAGDGGHVGGAGGGGHVGGGGEGSLRRRGRRLMRSTTAPNRANWSPGNQGDACAGGSPCPRPPPGRPWVTRSSPPARVGGAVVGVRYLGGSCYAERDGSEVRIFQQHCGGENLCVYDGTLRPGDEFEFESRRHAGFPFSLTVFVGGVPHARVSACCEHRHRRGARLGAGALFTFTGARGGAPCYRCVIARSRARKPTARRPEEAEEVEEVKEVEEAEDGTKSEERNESQGERAEGGDYAGDSGGDGGGDGSTHSAASHDAIVIPRDEVKAAPSDDESVKEEEEDKGRLEIEEEKEVEEVEEVEDHDAKKNDESSLSDDKSSGG